jgi:hypothetical protein
LGHIRCHHAAGKMFLPGGSTESGRIIWASKMSNFIAGGLKMSRSLTQNQNRMTLSNFWNRRNQETRLRPPLRKHQPFTMNFSYLTQRSILKFSHISLAEALESPVIERFQIGYSPAYIDAEHCGRALINSFLDRFEDDYRTFRHFQDG